MPTTLDLVTRCIIYETQLCPRHDSSHKRQRMSNCCDNGDDRIQHAGLNSSNSGRASDLRWREGKGRSRSRAL